jgi:DNA invertase Pin-like site-specific DNA recombinase
MSRPPKFTPQQQTEAQRRRAEGATLKELAKSYNVGRATISRLLV